MFTKMVVSSCKSHKICIVSTSMYDPLISVVPMFSLVSVVSMVSPVSMVSLVSVVTMVSQRFQLSRILHESHAFHLQLMLSCVAACFSRNQVMGGD